VQAHGPALREDDIMTLKTYISGIVGAAAFYDITPNLSLGTTFDYSDNNSNISMSSFTKGGKLAISSPLNLTEKNKKESRLDSMSPNSTGLEQVYKNDMDFENCDIYLKKQSVSPTENSSNNSLNNNANRPYSRKKSALRFLEENTSILGGGPKQSGQPNPISQINPINPLNTVFGNANNSNINNLSNNLAQNLSISNNAQNKLNLGGDYVSRRNNKQINDNSNF